MNLSVEVVEPSVRVKFCKNFVSRTDFRKGKCILDINWAHENE